MAKILIVDDEKNIINSLSSILDDEGHIVFSSTTGAGAIEFVNKNTVDLILLDVWLPDYNGLDLIELIKKKSSEIAIIMISGHGSIDIAVKSTKMGAFDFWEKPPSMDRVITSVNNALEHVRLLKENLNLKKEFFVDDEMIGSSGKMEEIRQIIKNTAETNARVFIKGASGTGKELVARAIYLRSNRVPNPFIKVNCAAIPDDLIESELFGHEKGAFTGAVSRRIGKFELANTGTIFLDEIGNMSLSAQAKVLRVLQEQQFERLGGNETITVDVRVVSATNVDIRELIGQGKFREDLYYRLNVIPIEVPPLKDRSNDIIELVKYFVDKFSKEHGLQKKIISNEAMDVLRNYSWPGNVRELKNIIERILIMVSHNIVNDLDVISHLDFFDYGNNLYNGDNTLKEAKKKFEKRFIIDALRKCNKNISLTAELVGMERTSLHRKIKSYNINLEDVK